MYMRDERRERKERHDLGEMMGDKGLINANGVRNADGRDVRFGLGESSRVESTGKKRAYCTRTRICKLYIEGVQ